jgi:hypothetical protein
MNDFSNWDEYSDLSDEDINTIKFDLKEILFNKFRPVAQGIFEVFSFKLG